MNVLNDLVQLKEISEEKDQGIIGPFVNISQYQYKLKKERKFYTFCLR